MLSDFCRIRDIRRAFGSTAQFCKELRLDNVYTKQLPPKFWDMNREENEMLVLLILVSKTILFQKVRGPEMSVGDYMAADKYFSRVGVDRKSAGDFKGSFGTQFDRIRENVKLADDMGFRLHFVVEATPTQMEKRRGKENGIAPVLDSFIRMFARYWQNSKDSSYLLQLSPSSRNGNKENSILWRSTR